MPNKVRLKVPLDCVVSTATVSSVPECIDIINNLIDYIRGGIAAAETDEVDRLRQLLKTSQINRTNMEHKLARLECELVNEKQLNSQQLYEIQDFRHRLENVEKERKLHKALRTIGKALRKKK